jgi:hypothetical protein
MLSTMYQRLSDVVGQTPPAAGFASLFSDAMCVDAPGNCMSIPATIRDAPKQSDPGVQCVAVSRET